MNPLDKLLSNLDADTKSIMPEVFLRAFDIINNQREALVQQFKNSPSRSSLLATYKRILNNYSTYHILWHRWARRNEGLHYTHREHWRNASDDISSNMRHCKTELMSMFKKVEQAFPGITYRELNKSRLCDLMVKWIGR